MYAETLCPVSNIVGNRYYPGKLKKYVHDSACKQAVPEERIVVVQRREGKSCCVYFVMVNLFFPHRESLPSNFESPKFSVFSHGSLLFRTLITI